MMAEKKGMVSNICKCKLMKNYSCQHFAKMRWWSINVKCFLFMIFISISVISLITPFCYFHHAFIFCFCICKSNLLIIIFSKGSKAVMAALEKLVRAFEAVKLSQGNPASGGGSVPGGSSQGLDQRPQEHTSTMASLASSLSQQSQGLLRYV